MSTPTALSLEERVTRLERELQSHSTAHYLARASDIFPKEKCVVFVGKNYFGDNGKYAFLSFYDQAKSKNIKSYYLTEDPIQQALLHQAGLPSLGSKDPHYLDIMLKTKVAVLSDNFYPLNCGGEVPPALLHGAKLIQLWHGIPLKEIGLHTFSHFQVMASCGPFNALVTTNAASRESWAKRFCFDEFHPLGHPRNDVFFRDPTPMDLLNVDMDSFTKIRAAKKEGRPTIFYAPTFRDYLDKPWFDQAGIIELARYAKSKGYEFCINLHPAEQNKVPELKEKFPDIWFLLPHTDCYPILRYADIVVTDYSSLAFDYLLLDRPILFYRPDHTDYIYRSRPLIEGREQRYTTGPCVYALPDLYDALDKTVANLKQSDNDEYQVARRALSEELFDYRDGGSSLRTCNLIEQYLDARDENDSNLRHL